MARISGGGDRTFDVLEVPTALAVLMGGQRFWTVKPILVGQTSATEGISSLLQCCSM